MRQVPAIRAHPEPRNPAASVSGRRSVPLEEVEALNSGQGCEARRQSQAWGGPEQERGGGGRGDTPHLEPLIFFYCVHSAF